jgi:colanic acid biosynthesis glycosyl transferase WcaI
MRILYVSQYFPPEMGAPAVRVSQLSRHWKDMGHDARVLTGFPNHPGGRIYPGFRRRFWKGFDREQFGGVTVYRTWLYPAANRGLVRRSAAYASFCLSAALRGCLLDFRPGVVIGTSPQLLCAQAAAWIARRHGAKFIFEVRDLWPESLAAVNACTPDSRLYRGLHRLAQSLYRQAWQVVVVTDQFRRRLIEQGVDPRKIAVVKNGVDAGLFRPGVAPAGHPEWAGKFLVSYVGTLGMAHSVSTILRAAELLRFRPDIHFLVAGNGAERENLLRQHREARLANVTFLGQVPWSAVPSYLALSSACIVHLARSPLFETVLPSKMFEIMASAKPLLLGVRGEAEKMLSEARAGISFEPESPASLSEAIVRLAGDPALCRRLGENGRDYVVRHCSFEQRAVEYLQALEPAQQPGLQASEHAEIPPPRIA